MGFWTKHTNQTFPSAHQVFIWQGKGWASTQMGVREKGVAGSLPLKRVL